MVTPPFDALRLVNGYRVFQMTVAACELKLPDLLADGPRTVHDLAATTDTHERSLLRLLRGLAAWGLVKQLPDDRFEATALADSFRSDRPGLRAATLSQNREGYAAWAHLMYSLRTGEPAFEHVFGKSPWAVAAENPEGAALFNASMFEQTNRIGAAVAAGYDLTGVATAVDVGGGNGALLTALLKARPDLKGILFDLPTGLVGARERLEAAGIAGRITIVEGNFFDSVPSDGDVYLLKSIVHDWDDAHAIDILKTCRQAMRPGARLVLVERILPDHVDQTPESIGAFMLDLHMMVVLGGRERTAAEYGELFASAGLRATRSAPIGGGFGYFEAVPA